MCKFCFFLHKLPILFACENNLFSVYTPIKERQIDSNFKRYADAFKIPYKRVDGNNIENVFNVSKKIIKNIKNGKGPHFIQMDTYRHLEHCGPNEDDHLNYRNKNEVSFWKKKDPLKVLENKLLKKYKREKLSYMKKTIDRKIDKIFSNVLKENIQLPMMQKNLSMRNKKKRQISFVEAIREGITQSLQKDKRLFLMGEGVDDPASMWGTIKGISKEFGKKRVLEMPVAENGLIGAAIGSSIAGSKVLVNLQRVEFSLYAFEQIVNNAAKSFYISRGKHSVPIVIRLVVGRGWGQGPEHAQSMENIFSSIPGLKVVIPTFPNEAKQLMINSLFDKNPVIFIEHRWLHYSKGEVNKKFKISKLKSMTK